MKDLSQIKEFFLKEETSIDSIKKQLDALGIKYEMSGNKFRPFKVIYKPVNKSDKFYNKFEDIIDLFNLRSVVKQSMSEIKEETSLSTLDINSSNKIYEMLKSKLGTDFTSEFATKSYFYFQVNDALKSMNEAMTTAYESKSISNYKVGDIISFKDGEDWKVMKVKDNVGKLVIKPHNEKAKAKNISLEIDIDLDYLKKNLKEAKSEAKSEDKVDTITMDIPLFIRMLEYSREDAAEDMDLHDVTEKAISLGKERGILQMDDYDEIVGDTKDSLKEIIKKTLKKKGISPKK
jgi:hypothetical protein